MDKKLIRLLTETLEGDNISATRQTLRGSGLSNEEALAHLWEASGLLLATGKAPKRSEFFSALVIVGEALDNEAIAWGNLEALRRSK